MSNKNPMPQSLARVAVHIVFSTKNRKGWLRDRTLCNQMYAYMATILAKNVDSPALLINGVEDHVHALCQLSRRFALMDVVKKMKTETSKWIKRQSQDVNRFSWQSGYGAFAVSESNIPVVINCIRNQEQHHQRMSFQDEFRRLCMRHGLELDERYAWD